MLCIKRSFGNRATLYYNLVGKNSWIILIQVKLMVANDKAVKQSSK